MQLCAVCGDEVQSQSGFVVIGAALQLRELVLPAEHLGLAVVQGEPHRPVQRQARVVAVAFDAECFTLWIVREMIACTTVCFSYVLELTNIYIAYFTKFSAEKKTI